MSDSSDYGYEFRERVLRELEQVRTEVQQVGDKLDEVRNTDLTGIKVEVAVLKTKAALIGAISGLVVSLIVAMLTRLMVH